MTSNRSPLKFLALAMTALAMFIFCSASATTLETVLGGNLFNENLLTYGFLGFAAFGAFMFVFEMRCFTSEVQKLSLLENSKNINYLTSGTARAETGCEC